MEKPVKKKLCIQNTTIDKGNSFILKLKIIKTEKREI